MEPVKVLLVDDEVTQRGYVKAVIENNVPNVIIVEATTPAEAFESIDDEAFDIAFIDYRLPVGEEGIDVLRYLKKKSPHAYSILMSGKVNLWTIQEATLADTLIDISSGNRDRESLIGDAITAAIRSSRSMRPVCA